jgi:hypothetical protein
MWARPPTVRRGTTGSARRNDGENDLTTGINRWNGRPACLPHLFPHHRAGSTANGHKYTRMFLPPFDYAQGKLRSRGARSFVWSVQPRASRCSSSFNGTLRPASMACIRLEASRWSNSPTAPKLDLLKTEERRQFWEYFVRGIRWRVTKCERAIWRSA